MGVWNGWGYLTTAKYGCSKVRVYPLSGKGWWALELFPGREEVWGGWRGL